MSDIWKYFEKCSKDEAKCKICPKKLSRKDGSTKGLWQHLKSTHNNEFVGLKENDSQKTEQETILSFVVQKKDAHVEAEEQIARIMLRQNNSFLFFEDKDLKDLYAKAYPNLKTLGSRKHFSRVVIPRMAEEVQSKIKNGVSTHFYAITSDGWSQPTLSPELQSVTIHWVDEKFCRNDMVLAAFPMDGFRKTGEILAEKVKNCVVKNGLSFEKMVCCVRDDAANMQMATRLMETESFQCCAHFLHLVVSEAVKMNLSEIVTKVKEWTKECRKSKTKEIFERHQEQLNTPKKQLIMPISTRWNSVFRMLKAFLEQKRALLSMQLERDQNEAGLLPKRPRLVGHFLPSSLPTINTSDFEYLRIVCPILQIFDNETQKFSKERSTASVILPTLKKISDFLINVKIADSVEPFINQLINSINDRVRKLIGNQLLRVSTLLDPRFAYDESIFSKANWALVEEDLIEFAKRVCKENESDAVENDLNLMPPLDESNIDLIDENSDDSIKYDIWNPKSPGAISIPSTLSGDAKIEFSTLLQLQLASYKAFGRPSIDKDVFNWWASNGQQFPDLVILAKIVHSIPATSVSSERLFSKVGLIFSNTLRNRLSGELVEKILVAKANLDSLFLAPSIDFDKEINDADDDIEIDNFLMKLSLMINNK